MEEALIARLLADAGVSALAGARVFPVSRPQGEPLPAVTLQRIDGAELADSGGGAGLTSARMQLDCWGASYASAKTVARAVVSSLSQFVGAAGAVTFQLIEHLDEQDSREGGSDAPEYLFRTRLDFIVWYVN